MKSPPSKIVQIVPETDDYWMVALCEDGSLWRMTPDGWKCVSEPHNPEGDRDADTK